MKLVCFDKIINLDKFESVRYRAGLGGGYPVEAVRHEVAGGFFGGETTIEEEIVRFSHERTARALVKAITNSWLANEQSFDVEKWLEKEAPNYTPAPEPNPEEERLFLGVLEAIEILGAEHQQQEKAISQIVEAKSNKHEKTK